MVAEHNNLMRARWQSVLGRSCRAGETLAATLPSWGSLSGRGTIPSRQFRDADLSPDRLTDVEVEALRAAHPATPPAEGHMRSAGYIAAMRAPMIVRVCSACGGARWPAAVEQR